MISLKHKAVVFLWLFWTWPCALLMPFLARVIPMKVWMSWHRNAQKKTKYHREELVEQIYKTTLNHHVLHLNCLERAHLLMAIAYSLDVPTTLVLGLKKKDASSAHAWIIINNKIVSGQEESFSDYTIIGGSIT